MYNRIAKLLFDNLEVKFIKSKILIACMLLLMIVSLSTVVASDIDDTSLSSNNDTLTVQNSDSDSTVLEQSDNDDTNIESSSESDSGGDLLASSSDEDVLGAGSRTDLQNLITNGGENVVLEDDYSLTGSAISITSNKVIDGQNHFIDGTGKTTRVIQIAGDNLNVTFKNIDFRNAYYQQGGSVIYSTSNSLKLTIINCTFSSSRGAIYLTSSSSSLDVFNSTFKSIITANNYLAIRSNSPVNVVNCTFESFTGSGTGRAISSAGLNLVNSTFKSFTGSGTLIYITSSSNITNCTFESIPFLAISGSNSNVANCSFESCSGAISGSNSNVTNCTFESCSGTTISGSNLNVANCSFELGSATSISSSGSRLNVDKCTFKSINVKYY